MKNLREYPLLVQSDRRILLYTDSPDFAQIRNQLSYFLELVKSPQIFYTYRINEVSLWNGFSHGWSDQDILDFLQRYSYYPLSESIEGFIREQYHYQNMFKLLPHSDTELAVIIEDERGWDLLWGTRQRKQIFEYLRLDEATKKAFIPIETRGVFKSEMIQLGYPVSDHVGFIDGLPVEMAYKHKEYPLRAYQEAAVASFLQHDDSNQSNQSNNTDDPVKSFKEGAKVHAGAGVIVLPCGAGKTILGIAIMAGLGMSTLIVTPNVVALRQWGREIVDKTNLSENDVGEYSGEVKSIRDVTLTTYQILTYRREREAQFHHLHLFNKRNWGLIIYDEIHMLPAKVFRFITSVQARRRLGLTATLVREDGKEREVYSLIGPKTFDYSWKDLEKLNFIARVRCFEVKISMPPDLENDYFSLEQIPNRFRLAAENPRKLDYVVKLVKVFKEQQILVIGQYLNQLEEIARKLKAPLLMGKTDYATRQRLYKDFNEKRVRVLVVSKIANFAVDLPNAEVAIQISGTFGSRQEEAQRLGRIVRPKVQTNADGSRATNGNNAYFLTLTTLHTREEFLAQNRKSFLMAQGYTYTNISENEVEEADKFFSKEVEEEPAES